jgi:phosphotransacetylase|tara:strand:+ start:721 stop:1137 length:417 start_codon:yes stop_codon:yes gene_type:complete
MLISEMVTEGNSKLLRDLYSYHLALVANSGISEDSFKSVQDSARQNLDQIIAASRPWEQHEKEDKITTDIAEFREDMRRIFDIDLDNEEEYAAYMEESEQFDAQNAELAEEEDEETVGAMIAKREEAVKERRRRSYSR